jgi:hypothetical protein
MFYNKQRSPTIAGIYDFNTLHLPAHNANINTKNYLLSRPPMSYRDLQLVVTNRIPSNLLILPKTSILQQQQKKEHKKPSKRTGFDVYRSLARSMTQTSERDIINDDITTLTNSLAIDRISPLSNTGFFRTQNLPKIQKHYVNQQLSNKIKTNAEHIEYIRSTSPEMRHPTTPTDQYYEENNGRMATPTKVISYIPKNHRNRKQLHVFMPAINC